VKKILVVDDEPTLVATLKYNLEQENYEVATAAGGDEALDIARSVRPDLIVLDLMLPGMNGLEVCRVLRKDTNIPILMLTAKGAEVDKVVGLEVGADDYVTKPFSMRELVARVKALLRRAEAMPSVDGEVLSSGDLRVDMAGRQAYKDDQPLVLKPRELDLLSFFLRNKGRAFTREQLLSQIWGYDFMGDTRTIDVHVRWLRQKIEKEPDSPGRLVTVRGTGYRFEG
jgi:two-component system alkaline phosphatase synthesis response regulator PhoP